MSAYPNLGIDGMTELEYQAWRKRQLLNLGGYSGIVNTQDFQNRRAGVSKPFPRNDWTRLEIWERRMVRIRGKIWEKRRMRVAEALYWVGWTWGALAVAAATIGMASFLMRMVLG